MPDDIEKVTESRPVAPVQMAVIGMGDTGKIPAQGVEAKTEGAHVPNFVVNVVSPFMAILIRFVNTFVTTLVALMTAGGMTGAIPANDFLHLLAACAMLSISVAVMGSLKDVVTIFGKLEQKFPLASGSV